MAATYSPDLRIELIGNGEQAGTWGVTTNTNLGTLIEQAIAGVVTVSLTNLTSYTLLALNGASDQARQAAIVFNGTLSANCNVVAPSVNKLYVLNNQTTGGFNVNIKTSSGNTYAITPNTTAFVYCDTLNFYDGLNAINSNLTLNAKAIIYGDVLGNVNTGQWFVPSGNTAQRTSSPVNGLIRYNSEGNFYEGYANASWVRFIVAPEGNYTITYLIIDGGGGGNTNGGPGGGGGAGGFIAGSYTSTVGVTFVVTVGGGGAAGTNGSLSAIGTIATGVGGGHGGYASYSGSTSGTSGSSGGGGAGGTGGTGLPGGSGGAGTSGIGNNGGAGGADNGSSGGCAGGGGGAGAVGGTGTSGGAAGGGGDGRTSSITGTSTYYAGGGGGGAGNGIPYFGYGGQGGGGNGGNNTGGVAATSGSTNTGGGGGGGGFGNLGANGGSGVVIMSIPTISYSGTTTGAPTVTTFGSNTILKFTASGSYTA